MKLLSVCFEWVVESSFMATIIIFIILLMKKILKDKVGVRWNHYIWFLVILRLLIPYAPESSISVFNVLPTLTENISLNKESTIKDKKGFNNSIDNREQNDDAVQQNQVITEKKYDFQRENVVYKKLNPKEYLTTIRKVIPRSSIGSDYLNKYVKLFQSQLPDKCYLDIYSFRVVNNSIVDNALMLIWILGIMVFLSYTIIINLGFFMKVHKNNKINNSVIDGVFNESKAIMRINRDIPIVYTKEVSTPSLMGIVKPKLLIPDYLTEKLSAEEFKYIFLHELSHLKRKDILVNWILTLIQIIHWFNPFIWYAFYKMRNDCEVACDSLAISFLEQEERKKYGLTIIHLLEFMKKDNWVLGMTGMLNNKSNIKRRISMISMFRKKSFKYTAAAIIIFIIIGGVTLTNAKSKRKLESLNNNISNENNYGNDKNSETDKILLGQVDIKGQGINIELSNSDFGVADYNYVRVIVNELINNGAEAISVNDERVIANSEIILKGKNIIINENNLSYPFKIKAIGDKSKLYSVMSSQDSYNKVLGMNYSVEKVDNLIIPKIKKQKELKYAQVIQDNNNFDIDQLSEDDIKSVNKIMKITQKKELEHAHVIQDDSNSNQYNNNSNQDNNNFNIDQLSEAVISNNIELVNRIIKNDLVNINSKDSEGKYPIEQVLVFGNCDMAKILLNAGANPNVITSQGISVYDIAMNGENKYMKVIFKQFKNK